MVSLITSKTDLLAAEGAFTKVFKSADPFGEPFQDGIRRRAILDPVPRELAPAQYEALSGAAETAGESWAYCSQIEGYDGSNFDAYNHARIELARLPYDELKEHGIIAIVEYAIYSPSGAWGLIASHERHAVVGGTKEFIETLFASLPSEDEQARSFVEKCADWRRGGRANMRWLPPFLTHMFGEERGRELLAISGDEGGIE